MKAGFIGTVLVFYTSLLYSQAIPGNARQVDTFPIKDSSQLLLKGVTVTAVTPKRLVERKIDRLIFNVERSVAATGGNALDVLRVTPGVRVLNDQVSMTGKSTMSVMVNSRLLKLTGDELIDYLKSIKVDEIKSIEVITNPPAKYEAEGNSGIVNIVLKKAKQNSWNAYTGASARQATYGQADQSAGLQYHKNSLVLYGSVLHKDGVSFYRTEKADIDYTDKVYRSESNMVVRYRPNIYWNAGLDYDFSKRISVGFQQIYSINKTGLEEDNNTTVKGIGDYLLQTGTTGDRKSTNNSWNMHAVCKLDTLGSSFNVNVDYFNYTINRENTFATYSRRYDEQAGYVPVSYYSAMLPGDQEITNYAVQADVEQKYKHFELEYGGKVSHTQTPSYVGYFNMTSGTPVQEDSKSDRFEYTENMQALYISGSSKIGAWEFKAGLRLENTQTKGYSYQIDTVNRNDYRRLFPTLYIMRDLGNKYTVSLSYGRRIQRPGYSTLNPAVRYMNPYTTSKGNPYLQPYFTNNIELNVSRNAWNNTLYFSSSRNMFEQVEYISNANINSATTYENFYDQTSAGLSESYTFYPVKNWESVNTCDIYFRKIHSNLPQTSPDFQCWSASVETNNSYTLNKAKTVFLSIGYWYQFREYDAIYDTRPYSGLSIGGKLLLFQKKLTLAVNTEDLLKTQMINNASSFNNIPTRNGNYEDRRCIRLSVKYSFGGSNITFRKVNASNREEKSRAY